MTTCNDMSRMCRSRMPETEIHHAFREVAVGGRDAAHGNRAPLHPASLSGDEAAARILVERGADVNAGDDEGHTPLCRLGICHGQGNRGRMRDMASLLPGKGADIPQSAKGTTALIEAARNRNFGMAGAIVDSGRRIDTTGGDGENALHTAAWSAGDIRRAERSLPDILSTGRPEEREARARAEAEKETGMLRKQEDGLPDLVRKLLDNGRVDPDDKSDCGETAWDIAAGKGAVKTAALPSGNDAEADGTLRQTGGMDIFQAMYDNNMEAFDALLRSGIGLQTLCEHKETYDFHGKSPPVCAFAWFTGLPGAAERLPDAGAGPNWRFPDGNTAFAVGRAHGKAVPTITRRRTRSSPRSSETKSRRGSGSSGSPDTRRRDTTYQ